MDNLRKLILSGFGFGYLPKAPGTWASLVPCAVFVVLVAVAAAPWWAVATVMAALAVASSVPCVAFGRFAETAFGKKDSRRCVLDEWAGQAVTLLFLPLRAGGSVWIPAAAAFVAFRAMDIIKPPPARSMEKLSYGWGVLLDDVVAGVYANVLCQVVLRVGFGT